ncbi:sulfotransferase domain-containing protein [Pseudodesulfovibrio methanolicus]|uniref:Sulfotransferase domain-containing protein n=1 Tax=Pseudodesulfovibrio methanolicus TaxID=3126690 RepID=A0ABZ2IS20_9BACT
MHPTKSLLKRLYAVTSALSSHSDERVFIACFPKSGSTFLRNVMAEITGYKTEEVCVGVKNDEQGIYLPALIDQAFNGISSRMHMKAKDQNIEILQKCGIRPVVLVRNIFDIVVSLRDHCHRTPIFAMVQMKDAYAKLSPEKQLDAIIDMLVPWYIEFYASWYRARESNAVDLYWTSYEEVMSDKPKAVRDICGFYGIKTSDEEIDRAIKTIEGDRKRSNFNVGKTGRGKENLTPEQIRKITGMAGYFEDIDFSSMGVVR